MIYVGIDVAKDKHDYFITNSDGEILFKAFTIPNNRNGFDELYQKIQSVEVDMSKIKVGLEATGHYSYNLLLAYAGISPSTYQSGQMESSYSHMEKRGSRYLRFALINAAKYVCLWDPTLQTAFPARPCASLCQPRWRIPSLWPQNSPCRFRAGALHSPSCREMRFSKNLPLSFAPFLMKCDCSLVDCIVLPDCLRNF